MSINTSDVARLRVQTGAGMMECKQALEEAGGDLTRAAGILRQKGIVKAAKRAGKVAAEGLVASYIHGLPAGQAGGGKIGVLVEVNCETDFVAKTDAFKSLVNEIAMQIAAAAPVYVAREDVPASEVEREKEVYRAQLKNEGKPNEMIEKIIEGKLAKYYGDVCLLEQAFIKDEEKTIAQLLAERMAEIGEKIAVRRFARFQLGEGMEKQMSNFAAEVEAQM